MVSEGLPDDSPVFDAFALIEAGSRDEAIEWSTRLASGHAGAEIAIRVDIEIRQVPDVELPPGGRGLGP